MRRRALLSMLAATASAGCSGFSGESRRGPGTFGVEDAPAEGGGGDALRPVGYSEFEGTVGSLPGAGLTTAVSPSETGLRSERGVRFSFDRETSEPGPATLKATLVNRSRSATVLDTSGLPAFEPQPVYRNETADVLAFAPTTDHPFATASPSVRRSESGAWTVSAVDDWLPRELEVGGLERVTGRYALVGVDELGTPSAGQYRLGGGDLGTTAYLWDATEPGPSTTSSFEPGSLPSLVRFEQWFHETTPSARAWLEPGRERVEPPAAVAFVLVNHEPEKLVGRDDRLQLYRLEDGSWYPLVWRTDIDISDPLLPGERARWTLRVAHDGSVPKGDGPAFPFLGGGTYAFASFYEDGFAAAFDLAAPSLGLEPTPGVRTTRDGDALVVTGPEWTGAGPVIELSETDVSPAVTLVTEQLYRDPVLRNTVAFAGDAPVVRYRTSALSKRGPFRLGRGDATFRYAGETYALTLASDAVKRGRRPDARPAGRDADDLDEQP